MAVETQLDTSKGLKIAKGRIAFIDNASVKGDRGYYRLRDPRMTLIMRSLTRALFCKPRLLGIEYLDYISGIIRSREEELMSQENEQDNEPDLLRITIASNHTSDFDHPCLEYALLANGYTKLAERLLFGSGLKMWDRPQTSWAMGGLNTFPVAAPGYFKDADLLSKQDLSAEKKGLVATYIQRMERLNRDSFRAIHEDWEDGKSIVVIYPETTRSRDGLLKKGRIEIQGYLRHGLILPVMIQGVEEVFPPGKFPRLLKSLKRDAKVTVTANEPIDANILRSSKTREWLAEKSANLVDFVMSRIAVLNLDRVDPKYVSLYESLTEDIPEGLILKAA